jgi:hypothetical protein
MLCVATVVSLVLLMAGCDVGTNPLIFDGTPAEATFEITSVGSVFPPITYIVDLQSVLSDINDYVDSIKVYNISMKIENLGGTNSTISGNLTINKVGDPTIHQFVSLNGTPISAFATEKSIFDPSLAASGFTYSPTVVPLLNGFLKDNPKPTVDVVASGTSTAGHYIIHVKVYSQVFTTP